MRSAIDATSRDLSTSTASNAPPSASTSSSSAWAASRSSAVLRLDHRRPVEQVAVLEQVGLVRQHLLHPQRPLLIPWRRQSERLVPRRQLDRARPRPLRQRDAEHLEHDPLHVVLGLCLRQAERVDLHAVPEASGSFVGDAVALAADPVPQLRHRPQLADLLHEPDAGVDEERDRPEHGRETVVGNLARVAHGVEHADRSRHRVGDLLDGRRPRLLQVVRADVGGVPERSVLGAPGDHVDDQTPRRLGREDVRAARQVLLHDVVLCRAAQRPRVDPVLLGVDDVQREQPRRGGVDRHRRVHPGRRDAVEQRPHVAEMGDRHADLADLATRATRSRGRIRSASADRRRSTARSGPWRGSCGRASFDAVAVECPE